MDAYFHSQGQNSEATRTKNPLCSPRSAFFRHLEYCGKQQTDLLRGIEECHETNDLKAVDFISWYDKKYVEEHNNPYPDFIKKCCELIDEHKKLPKIKVMIRVKERYSEDHNQEILVFLKNEKLRSIEELQIEIKRQMLVFLEMINYKRSNSEPRINEKQITVSTFLDIEENGEEIEIVYAIKIYISMIKRFLIDIRKKIKELTEWK